LFERVLALIDPYYESKGIFVLSVEGIGFKPYIDILSALKIRYVIKTDNDIIKMPRTNPVRYRQAGFRRINDLINYINLIDEADTIPVNDDLSENDITPDHPRRYYDENIDIIDNIRYDCRLYLSHCDLEEDIGECIEDIRFCELLEENTVSDCISRLKTKKQHMMVELANKLSDSDCRTIYNHYNFACLKAVCNDTD